MPQWIRSLFSTEHLIPQAKRLGEIPTTRDAYRDVARIAFPSVLEMVLVSLVGSIDTMMVGSIGPEAIAAVGLTGQPRMLMLCVFFALNIGVTAVVARRKGEGRQQSANLALRNGLMLVLIISVVMLGIAMGFARPMMRLAGAKADTIDDASMYFMIITSILPLNAATLCINAAQRGVGNTRITMYVNIVSNLVNIVLNWLLIGGNLGFPKLGVKGAAIATMMGFLAGFCMSVYSITTKKNIGHFLHIERRDKWHFDKESLHAIGKVGGNAMLEQVFLRIGFFTYARLVADLGTLAFASHQICMQFLMISFSFGDGIGIAGTSLVGQMMGKKRPDLSLMYGKIAQRMALVVAMLLASFIAVLRYPLVSLFTSDMDVLTLSASVMLLVAAFQPIQTSAVVISGCLRGAGDTRYVAIVMMVCVAVMRPVLAYVGIHWIGLGLVGAWSASLVDMLARLTLVYLRFSSGKWFAIKV